MSAISVSTVALKKSTQNDITSSLLRNQHLGTSPALCVGPAEAGHYTGEWLELLADLAEGEDGLLTNVGVGVFERSDQRINGARVAQLAEGVCRLLPHFRIGVFQRGDERID